MRVHELAKELGCSSKDLLGRMKKMGVEAKSHMSALDDASVKLIRDELGGASTAQPSVEKEPAEEKKAPVKKTEVDEVKPEVSKEKPEQARPEPARPEPAKPESVKPAQVPPAQVPPAQAKTEAEKAPEKKAVPASVAPQQGSPQVSPAQGSDINAEDGAIKVRGSIVVKDFAEAMNMRPNKLIAELMGFNVLASINQKIDINVARKIAEKHGFTLEQEKKSGEGVQQSRALDEDKEKQEDRPEDMRPRAPVVTFLGHVDHGKTSLLDRIRNASVVTGESGGITQHIGAYTVEFQGRNITFLDTPGHAAFTAMRARGANMTDIAVIIIAADDGIMPQTREAIKHAQASGVSIMVAINKIDLPAANVDGVKTSLQGEGLTPEDWGGEIICAPVSAQTGEGVDHLLEMILLQSEILELTANPDRRAQGYVIEAELEPGMGPVANVLVKQGTLKVGDFLLCDRHCGKVKALIDDHGVKVKSAGPSKPVKCMGLSGVPEAGSEFRVYANEKMARQMAASAAIVQKDKNLSQPRKASLDDLFAQIKENEKLDLRIILKADTQGSVEAISHALFDIKSDKISLNIILAGTGSITVNDVMLASASNAVIMGFHVPKEPGVDASAKHEGVEVRLHQVIYEVIDEVRDAMTGLLAPVQKETVTGRAEIRQVFKMGKTKNVAGCLVIKGYLKSRSKVRVIRNEEVLFEGAVSSLKHFQDEVAEIKEAQECGIQIADFNNFEEGDILEFYSIEELKQSL